MTDAPAPAARDDILAAHHRRFLAFLRPRVESDAAAEDLLQEAYARALGKLGDVRDDASVVAWFYQVLRNAVVDHHRRAGAETSAHAALARATDDAAADAPDLRANVCACLRAVLPALAPAYAEIVSAVDLDERPVAEVAAARGLTSNNAAVRLHRARAALRRRLVDVCGACAAHGCLDCTCRRHR